MNSLIDGALDKSRTVILIFLLIVVAGTIAYRGIPKEDSPDVQIPIIYISMFLEGISPEDSERLLLRPLEKRLSGLDGLKEIRSNAYESGGSIVLEFFPGFNSETALQDVREKVDEAAPELPSELVDEPTVNEVNFSLFPVVNVILTGDIQERVLVKLARNMRDRIEAIPQVLEVNISGNREEMLEVLVDPMVVQSYGLSPQETFSRVRQNNALIAAGNMDTGLGSVSMKVPGLLEDVHDFFNLPIKVKNESIIRLEDIATIRRTFKDPEGFARVNGRPAIGLEVSKRPGENLIETVEAVRALVEEERKLWPDSIQVLYAQDTSDNIRDMLSNLQNNILLAVFLVLVVMIAAMGVRSALLVSLSIPGAFLAGIIMLALLGFTLNIVVLFSLILSIGMLVDAAIVTVEDAARRMQAGVSGTQAYGQAAKRMAWPVISSTITTLIVFMPLLFWPGIVGQFMFYMPMTLIMTLAGSLLMALVFMPTIGTVFARRLEKKQQKPSAEIDPDMLDDDWDGRLESLPSITERYGHMLRWVIASPGKTSMMVIGGAIAIMVAYGAAGKGVEFFPAIEPQNITVLVQARGNLAAEEKDAVVQDVARAISPIMDDVKVMFAKSGIFRRNEVTDDVIGMINVEFKHWQSRRSAKEIIADIYSYTNNLPGIKIEVREQEQGPPVGKPVQLELRSRYPDALIPAANKVLEAMNQFGGFLNIEDSRPVPAFEWRLKVDRQRASLFGADVQTAGSIMKLVSNGLIADNYRPDDADEEIDVVVRFPEDHRNVDELDQLRIPTSQRNVPIGLFVEREAQATIGTIKRVDQSRVITIKADVAEDILPDQKVKEIRDWLLANDWDPRVTVAFKGEDKEQQEAANFLQSAFLLALFGMFLTLVTQFNSIYQTFVVMSAVFFSTIGVFLGLLITQQPFGIVMCGVGVISLAGIVVNNNIILIDTYSKMLKRGYSCQEAMLRTGVQRLRPVLLTAGTTILGLIPMVIGMNIDFVGRELTFGAPSGQWWIQLSTAIAGGLTFATVLTLFFTPALLMLGNRMSQWIEKKSLRLGAPLKQR